MKYFGFMAILLLATVTSSCQHVPGLNETLELAASTENKVEVTISLEHKENNQFFLSATFTPLDPSLHLYSKEIPLNGVDGLGRPTFLGLAAESLIKANGELIESVPSQIPAFEPIELLVYPIGEVTLSLPILLPDGNHWINDQVIVTYMACNEQGCRPPVEGKVIMIRIPGKELFK